MRHWRKRRWDKSNPGFIPAIIQYCGPSVIARNMNEASRSTKVIPAGVWAGASVSEAITRAALASFGLAIWIGRGVDLGVATLQVVDVTALVLILLAMANGGQFSSFARPRTPLTNSFLMLILSTITLIVASGLFSGINAVDLGAVVRFILRYALGLLLVLSLFVLLDRPSRVRVLVKWVLIGAVSSVGVSVVGLYVPTVGELTVRYGDRSQAFMNHPNQLAMLLTTVLPIAIAVALGTRRRVLGWLAVLITAGGLAMTGSKLNVGLLFLGALAFTMLAMLTYPGLIVRLKFLLRATAATLVLVGLAVGVLAYVTPRTINTILRLLTEPADVSAVASRLELWQTALQFGWQYPLTGIGAANAEHYLPFDHAHNVFMDFFMAMGIPGLLSLALFLLVLTGLALASVARGIFDRSLPQYSRLLLTAMPVAMALYVAANQSSDSFGGTTLPVLWLVIALNLAILSHARSLAGMQWKSEARCKSPPPLDD